MSSVARVVVVALMILAAWPLNAQELSDSQVFYAVAHTAGRGDPPTQWRSDVTLYNVQNVPITVGLQLFLWGSPNQFDTSFPVRIALAARETRTIEDVVATAFGITGDAAGTLMATCSSDFLPANPPGAVMAGSSRTYNIGSPGGTYGQSVPATDRLRNCWGTLSYVTGARNDARYRSNLGIINVSFFDNTIHYRIRRGNGTVVAQGSKHLGVLTGNQYSFASLGVPKVSGPLTVELWLDPADVIPGGCSPAGEQNCFVAYVSKADGNPTGTGDAEFLMATPTDEPVDCVEGDR